jgi:hypothetical protein
MFKKAFFIALNLVLCQNVFSHSGRTDSSGCHQNKRTGDYHCHNDASNFTKENSSNFNSNECPVVGNTDSNIYHVSGGRFYETMLERNSDGDNRKCFNSESEAEGAGFRRSKR